MLNGAPIKREVFTSSKYDRAWDLLFKLGPEHAQQINEKGTAFAQGWNQVLEALASECFNADRTELDYEKVFQGGKAPRAVRERFHALQRNEAKALCDAVASTADAAFTAYVTDEIQPLPSSAVGSVSTAEEQAIPPDFQGKKFSEIVQFKDLSEEARGTIDKAHALVFGHVCDKETLLNLAKQQYHDQVACVSCEP